MTPCLFGFFFLLIFYGFYHGIASPLNHHHLGIFGRICFSKTVSKHRGQANQSFGAGGKRRNFIDNSHSVWRMIVHPLIHTHHQHARIIPTLCPDTQEKINMFVCPSCACVCERMGRFLPRVAREKGDIYNIGSMGLV